MLLSGYIEGALFRNTSIEFTSTTRLRLRYSEIKRTDYACPEDDFRKCDTKHSLGGAGSVTASTITISLFARDGSKTLDTRVFDKTGEWCMRNKIFILKDKSVKHVTVLQMIVRSTGVHKIYADEGGSKYAAIWIAGFILHPSVIEVSIDIRWFLPASSSQSSSQYSAASLRHLHGFNPIFK